MMLTIIVLIVSVLALGAVLLLVCGRISAGQGSADLAARLRPIDVKAFRNLVDEHEQDFLRERLPGGEFRRIHRERMLAATQYVWGAARNAGILIRLGETAKGDSDPAVVAAAESLQENALRMRLYSLQTLPRLYVSMFVPNFGRAPHGLAENYDRLTRQMVTLGCLQSPARVVSRSI